MDTEWLIENVDPVWLLSHPNNFVQHYIKNASYNAALLEDTVLAMTAALTALAFGQPVGDQGCAQGHCNFYTMPLMIALQTLHGMVHAKQIEAWQAIARSIIPSKSYMP